MKITRIIDLTKPITHGMRVYTGDPEVTFQLHVSLKEKGYRVTKIQLGTHTGTHIDAPMHMIDKGESIDKIPLEELVGVAKKIRVNKKVVEERDIPDLKENVNTIFLIETREAGYLTKEAARKIVKLGVKTVIFHEKCYIDEPGNSDYPIHKYLLKSSVHIVSEAINFDEVKDGDLIIVAPLKLVGVDGAPCRVVALREGD